MERNAQHARYGMQKTLRLARHDMARRGARRHNPDGMASAAWHATHDTQGTIRDAPHARHLTRGTPLTARHGNHASQSAYTARHARHSAPKTAPYAWHGTHSTALARDGALNTASMARRGLARAARDAQHSYRIKYRGMAEAFAEE